MVNLLVLGRDVGGQSPYFKKKSTLPVCNCIFLPWVGKLRLRKEKQGARAPGKASAKPNRLHNGMGKLLGTGDSAEWERQSHLTEGNTEALSFQGPTAGAVGREKQGLRPGSGWGILGAGVQGVWGAGALPETDGSAAPSPQRRPRVAEEPPRLIRRPWAARARAI